MNKFIVLFCALLFISCNTDKKETVKKAKKEKMEMYSLSELALLMEEMYAMNDSIKSQIIKGETPTKFPEKLLNIHTAQMTDRFERDAVFDILAKSFIEGQQSIYTSTPETIKSNFNSTINVCVACHENTCTGPIPRIKKLYIK